MGLWISDHWRRLTSAVHQPITGCSHLFVLLLDACLSWGQYPACSRSLAHKGITSEKKQLMRETARRSRPHVCERLMFPNLSSVGANCSIKLVACARDKTGLYVPFYVFTFIQNVFLCFYWCGLFEDVHSKTGHRVAGGIKVLTPLH